MSSHQLLDERPIAFPADPIGAPVGRQVGRKRGRRSQSEFPAGEDGVERSSSGKVRSQNHLPSAALWASSARNRASGGKTSQSLEHGRRKADFGRKGFVLHHRPFERLSFLDEDRRELFWIVRGVVPAAGQVGHRLQRADLDAAVRKDRHRRDGDLLGLASPSAASGIGGCGSPSEITIMCLAAASLLESAV